MRFNDDGTLDSSFGAGTGRVRPIGFDEGLNAVAILPGGEIVAAGTSFGSAQFARFDATGVSQAGFDFGSATGMAEGRALAVQADGKIIVVGYSLEGSTNRNFAVVRIIFPTAAFSAPTLDNSFGSNGIVKTDFGTDSDVANAVAVQADGKIVVAGETNNAFAVARYNSDGSPDLSFNGGKISTQLSSSGTKANALAIQGDGKIVVTGKADMLPSYGALHGRWCAGSSL